MAKILVVEDEQQLRSTLAIALRREGHEVDAVARGEDGVAFARDGSFDLVIADVRLEGISGLEVLRALRQDSPETGVILMSAFGSVETAVEAMQAGAHDFLRKPIDPLHVTSAVNKALSSRGGFQTAAVEGEAELSAFPGIIGKSRAIRELLDVVAKVAVTDSTVLITGETGTGKELIGRAIHHSSVRHDRVFCAVNSAAFPETLLESELFGHRRGAFTGASVHKKGLFEHAHQGTVFLDEVAEMPVSMQAKLLRFLQTGEIRPVGGEATRCVDVRLVTATNKELEREVEAGRFREDLYYRLAVIPVCVPPLRDRSEDIPYLAAHFCQRFASKLNKPVETISAAGMDALLNYWWPGNVRELENCIERAVALGHGVEIGLDDLPARICETPAPAEPTSIASLQVMERAHILNTLEKVGWNRKRAAELLQISTTTLWRRLKDFGIDSDPLRSRRPAPVQSPRGF